MVTITSLNIDPSAKISRQRQNTSISDGNRNRGKNSEANCQSAITTMKAVPTPTAASPPRTACVAGGGDPVWDGGVAHLPGAW